MRPDTKNMAIGCVTAAVVLVSIMLFSYLYSLEGTERITSRHRVVTEACAQSSDVTACIAANLPWGED